MHQSKRLKFHPFANIFPKLSEKEIGQLAIDIKNNGLKTPIILFQNKILDGRNRYLACKKARVRPSFVEYSGKNPLGDIVSLNLIRRHLNESQRAVVAEKLANLSHGGDRKGTDQGANLRFVSIKKAAELLNISARSINSARFIKTHVPERLREIDSGQKTINEILHEIKTRKIPSDDHGKEIVCNSIIGNNADLMQYVARLYIRKTDAIADLTYGRGCFWKKVDLSENEFYPSDLVTTKPGYDFIKLPYPDNKFDVVILDPPFRHHSSDSYQFNENYQNYSTTKGMSYENIIKLYSLGMAESFRILKKDALLMVKCQDQIESSEQKRGHIEIYNTAMDMGFEDIDLFILIQKKVPIIRERYQIHARKSSSFLWVFRKKQNKFGSIKSRVEPYEISLAATAVGEF